MEVKVKQIDGLKFSVEARAHKVICDQPLDNGGEDAGMTPPEFMLGSLGTCANSMQCNIYVRAGSMMQGWK